MKKILNTILISLFLLILTCGASFAAVLTDTAAEEIVGKSYVSSYGKTAVIPSGDNYIYVTTPGTNNGSDVSSAISATKENWIYLQGSKTDNTDGTNSLNNGLTIPDNATVNIIIGANYGTPWTTWQGTFNIGSGAKLTIYGETDNPNICWLNLANTNQAPYVTGSGTLNVYSGEFQVQENGSTSNYLIDGLSNINVYGGYVSLQRPDPDGPSSIDSISPNTTVNIEGGVVYSYANLHGGTSGYEESFADLNPLGGKVNINGNCIVAASDITPSQAKKGIIINNGKVNFGLDNPNLGDFAAYSGTATVVGNVTSEWPGNTENMTINQLDIPEGSSLTVTDGQNITISTLKNNGTLVVEQGGNVSYSNDNPGNDPIDLTPTPSTGYNGIIDISLTNTALSFYATTGTQTSTQTQNVGLSIISVPSNSYYANALTWTLTPVASGYGQAPVFTNNWSWGVDDNGNTYISMGTDDESFTLKQYINKTGIGDTVLEYYGEEAYEGIYTLEAKATGNYWAYEIVKEAPSDSVRVIINDAADIAKLTIVNLDGSKVTNPVSINLNNTTSTRFGYVALDGDDKAISVSETKWDLIYTSDPSKTSQYAHLNSTTGQINFYQPTGNGYLLLTLEADGFSAENRVLIQVTGTEITLTDIAAVQDPAYTYATNTVLPFNLSQNIVGVPNEIALNTDNLEFTSSNPYVIVYGGNQLVTSTIGYTGTTTITATYTVYDEDDPDEVVATYTTDFDLIIVDEEVVAKGITAEEELTFVYGTNMSQNVNAQLSPEGTTTQIDFYAIDYSSANEDIAYVNDFGDVFATGVGTTTITTIYNLNGTKVKAETIVTVLNEAPVTAIELAPQDIVLSTDGDNTSQVITATLTPEDSSAIVSWNISPETVATLVDNGDNTATVTAVADGEAYVTATVGDVTATTKVTVTSSPVVVGSVEITSDDPSYFTVTAYNVTSMVEGETPQYLALFAWSTSTQSDINAKPMTHIEGTDNWVVENIPVNDTPINNYFDIADSITLNMYGSNDPDDNGSEIWNGTYSWVNAQNIGDNSVAYIGYSQNLGFVHPTAFDGEQAGTTQQALQMEGLRVSSGIEGVQIEANVHVQDYGWMGYVADGTYAGTMHENKQMEAVQLRLVGDNAGDYTLRYRAHVQDYGWLDWVTTGQTAGTTDQFLQMEAIQIELVPVDAAN